MEFLIFITPLTVYVEKLCLVVFSDRRHMYENYKLWFVGKGLVFHKGTENYTKQKNSCFDSKA